MSSQKVFRLNCAVQKYDWGKPGSKSEVAQLSQSGNNDFTLDESSPYAELWMGTHPKGPAAISTTGESLSQWLIANPDAVGESVTGRFPISGQLPFLFKVLSVNKSLSIQAHPNKKHAEQLHSTRPDKYPDPNHKPEMAIALTPFEALCGFRPKEEIVAFLKGIPEFRSIVGETNSTKFESASLEEEKDALHDCFQALMTADPADVKDKVGQLAVKIRHIRQQGEGDAAQYEGELFLRLDSQFPGDCGCFCIYFMNHLLLQPGQAIFLAANLPHAYLAGDCLECMACSDNVVRAGLTPKFKDVSTLCSMLNYSCKPAAENMFTSHSDPDDPCVTVFNPPVPDFGVNRIQLPSSTQRYSMSAMHSASICLVIEGSADINCNDPIHLTRGSVLFVAAKELVDLDIKSDGMLIFRAYCSL